MTSLKLDICCGKRRCVKTFMLATQQQRKLTKDKRNHHSELVYEQQIRGDTSSFLHCMCMRKTGPTCLLLDVTAG